jgi:hypothetical protein
MLFSIGSLFIPSNSGLVKYKREKEKIPIKINEKNKGALLFPDLPQGVPHCLQTKSIPLICAPHFLHDSIIYLQIIVGAIYE